MFVIIILSVLAIPMVIVTFISRILCKHSTYAFADTFEKCGYIVCLIIFGIVVLTTTKIKTFDNNKYNITQMADDYNAKVVVEDSIDEPELLYRKFMFYEEYILEVPNDKYDKYRKGE